MAERKLELAKVIFQPSGQQLSMPLVQQKIANTIIGEVQAKMYLPTNVEYLHAMLDRLDDT